MTFDLEQTDALLSTTRAVRLRLDLERDVPDDLLLRCIELAEQAQKEGFNDLRRSGLDKVIQGVTSLAEANRMTTGH